MANVYDNWLGEWKMFSTPRKEVEKMLDRRLKFEINPDGIFIHNYLFRPFMLFNSDLITPESIEDIDLNAHPPNVRVGAELIILPQECIEQLKSFAAFNNIPILCRANVWSWILEPFLDTEYSEEIHQKMNELLEQHGLGAETVELLRKEVGEQMFKYNFDTMLWEWVELNLYDVLMAMHAKYNKVQFLDFYRKAMKIALLPKNQS